MSETSESHPLDETYEFEGTEPRREYKTSAYLPLLRPSVAVAAGGFICTFLASIATINATPNSLFEFVTGTLTQIGRWVVFVALCGILMAYRIPHIQKLEAPEGIGEWVHNGYGLLVIANLIGVVLIGGFVLVINAIGIPLFGFLSIPLLYIFTGLMVTMAVWHKNYLRAYAIGVLTVIFLMNSGFSMMLFSFPMGGRGGGMGGMNGAYVFVGLAICVPPLSGLCCAGYVILLEQFSKSKKEDTA